MPNASLRYIRPELHGDYKQSVTHAYNLMLTHKEFSIDQDKMLVLAHYPYFYCLGRHSKRTECKQKGVLIYEVEDKITEYYKRVEFDDDSKDKIRTTLEAEIKEKKQLSGDERMELYIQRNKIERRQSKLMEAYYDNVINKDVLKVEQDKLASIKEKLELAERNYELTKQNLNLALELIHNCHEAYKQAPDHIRRMFN